MNPDITNSPGIREFTVWVDGDSCPASIRSIIERAAHRRKFQTVFVSDRKLPIEKSKYCRQIIVASGDDAADDRVATLVKAGDLVVTRDVTLTQRVVLSGATAMDDRGGVFTRENTGERKSLHDFMSSLRDAGVYPRESGRALKSGTKGFADAFDRILTKTLN